MVRISRLSETAELITHKRKERLFGWNYSHQSFLIIQHVDNLKTTEAGSTGNKGTVMYHL